MSTILAGSRPNSQGSDLSQIEALFQLHAWTGVQPVEWLEPLSESADVRAERLEFLADVMLGIAQDDREAARRVARLYRMVLSEPADVRVDDPVFGPVPEIIPAVIRRLAEGKPRTGCPAAVPDAVLEGARAA